MTSKFIGFCTALLLLAAPIQGHAETTRKKTTTTTTTTTTDGDTTQTTHSGMTMPWLGVEIGPNFSKFTNAGGADGSTEFVGGVFADWNINSLWNFSTGLRFNTYGIHQTAGGVESRLSADYLEIPLLIKPMIDAGGWYPYLLAGPNLAFKVGERVSQKGNGVSQSISTSGIETFDFSFDLGLGAEVPITPNLRGFAQFEYALGLTNVLKDSSSGTAKTRGAMLLFGVVAGF